MEELRTYKYMRNMKKSIWKMHTEVLNRQETEYPPIAGMDENTITYLLTSIGIHCGKIDEAEDMVLLCLYPEQPA